MSASVSPAVACPVCDVAARALGAKSGYDHYLCPQCGHLFVWPIPRNFREIYSEDYFSGAAGGFGYSDYDRDKEPMTPVFEEYLDRIEAVTGRKGLMLDIGCATGFYLCLARNRGWDVRGVEASAHAASIARGKGLDVRTGILEECSFPESSFDVITMWDVLEHIEKPGPVLDLVGRLLKPNGVLVINTPDAGSLLARMAGMMWHLVVPPEHLNLFSRKSLSLSLDRMGFQVKELTTIGKRFTVQYVVQTLLHRMPALARLAAPIRGTRIGLVDVSINLHDNMFLLAQKR